MKDPCLDPSESSEREIDANQFRTTRAESKKEAATGDNTRSHHRHHQMEVLVIHEATYRDVSSQKETNRNAATVYLLGVLSETTNHDVFKWTLSSDIPLRSQSEVLILSIILLHLAI